MTSSPAVHSYRRDIDGLRAIAVLSVILHHLNHNLIPSGYLGVDVFFVISGYVITRSLLGRHQDHVDRVRLGPLLASFYARRIQRLLPALMACTLMSTVFVAGFIPPDSSLDTRSLATGLTALFGLSNLYLWRQSTDYFGMDAELNLFTQTWSLGVEEQFYFVFPALLWWLSRWHRPADPSRTGSRRVRIMIMIISATSALLFMALSHIEAQAAAYFLMPARFWELGVGVWIGLGVLQVESHEAHNAQAHRVDDRWWWGRAEWAIIGLLISFWIPLRYSVLATSVAVGCTGVLITTLQPRSIVYRWLASRVMVGIGLISYSLYLWHWVVLASARWTFGIKPSNIGLWIALMVALAWMSYRWIERPLRHARWANSSIRVIGVGLILMTLGGSLVWGLARPWRGLLYLGVDHWGTMTRVHLKGDPSYLTRECHVDPEDAPSLPRPACVMMPEIHSAPHHHEETITKTIDVNPRRRPSTLFLLGDSHTNHLRPLHLTLKEQLKVQIDGLSQSGCPFYGWTEAQHRAHQRREPSRCSVLQAKQRSRIERDARSGDVVIISNRYLIHQRWGEVTRPSWLAEEGVVSALNDFADQLHQRGVRVGLVLPLPEFELNVYTCQPQLYRSSTLAHCVRTTDELRALRATTYALIDQDLTPLIARFDPLPILCNDQKHCGMIDAQGLPIYRDRDHLSRHGASLLAQEFSPWVQRLLTNLKLDTREGDLR